MFINVDAAFLQEIRFLSTATCWLSGPASFIAVFIVVIIDMDAEEGEIELAKAGIRSCQLASCSKFYKRLA